MPSLRNRRKPNWQQGDSTESGGSWLTWKCTLHSHYRCMTPNLRWPWRIQECYATMGSSVEIGTNEDRPCEAYQLELCQQQSCCCQRYHGLMALHASKQQMLVHRMRPLFMIVTKNTYNIHWKKKRKFREKITWIHQYFAIHSFFFLSLLFTVTTQKKIYFFWKYFWRKSLWHELLQFTRKKICLLIFETAFFFWLTKTNKNFFGM